MFAECNQCEDEFENVSQHWAMSSECDAPSLTEAQKQVISGLILGDGSIVKPTKNSRLQVSSTNYDYLCFLHNQTFSNLSSGVPEKKSSSEESAKIAREGGLDENARAENYNDIYSWRTTCIPEMNNWRTIQNNKEVSSLEIAPAMMKHWYVSDGSYFPEHGRGRVKISIWNYRNKKEEILSMFNGISVSKPTWRQDESRCSIVFTATGTQELFEYMGEPLPGFQMKWGDNQ